MRMQIYAVCTLDFHNCGYITFILSLRAVHLPLLIKHLAAVRQTILLRKQGFKSKLH